MFNNNKSDFASTIGGFFIVGFVALLLGVYSLDFCWDFMDYPYMGTIPSIACIIGIITGFICLYKAFLTEGFTFILVSVCGYTVYVSNGMMIALAFLVLFAIVGFMGFREGYLDLAIINGLFALFSFIAFGFDFYDAEFIFVFLGLFMIAAAAVSFYVAVVEWMGAQDFIQEYEEAVFGGCCCDDDCDCGCEDGECTCGDECTCHKDE